MAKNTLPVIKVERDFKVLCEALEGLSDRGQTLFLAKLALVLCDLVEDSQAVEDAISRAKLNLDTTEAA